MKTAVVKRSKNNVSINKSLTMGIIFCIFTWGAAPVQGVIFWASQMLWWGSLGFLYFSWGFLEDFFGGILFVCVFGGFCLLLLFCLFICLFWLSGGFVWVFFLGWFRKEFVEKQGVLFLTFKYQISFHGKLCSFHLRD